MSQFSKLIVDVLGYSKGLREHPTCDRVWKNCYESVSEHAAAIDVLVDAMN